MTEWSAARVRALPVPERFESRSLPVRPIRTLRKRLRRIVAISGIVCAFLTIPATFLLCMFGNRL